jgi:hypothetical protein
MRPASPMPEWWHPKTVVDVAFVIDRTVSELRSFAWDSSHLTAMRRVD